MTDQWRSDAQEFLAKTHEGWQSSALDWLRRYEEALTAAEQRVKELEAELDATTQMLHDQRNAVSKKAVEKYVARIAELEAEQRWERASIREHEAEKARLGERIRAEVGSRRQLMAEVKKLREALRALLAFPVRTTDPRIDDARDAARIALAEENTE